MALVGLPLGARVDNLPGQLGVLEPGDADVDGPVVPGALAGDLLDAVDSQGLPHVDAEVLSARTRGKRVGAN